MWHADNPSRSVEAYREKHADVLHVCGVLSLEGQSIDWACTDSRTPGW
jgi:hypothetical protein